MLLTTGADLNVTPTLSWQTAPVSTEYLLCHIQCRQQTRAQSAAQRQAHVFVDGGLDMYGIASFGISDNSWQI